jgi:hypothetical protein
MNVSIEAACLSQAFGFWTVWKIEHNVGHFSIKPVALLCFIATNAEKPASQRYVDENGMMTCRACSLVLG